MVRTSVVLTCLFLLFSLIFCGIHSSYWIQSCWERQLWCPAFSWQSVVWGAEAGKTILSSLTLYLERERVWILKSLEASCGAMNRLILQPISKLRWLHSGSVPYWGFEGLKQKKEMGRCSEKGGRERLRSWCWAKDGGVDVCAGMWRS